ncbi:hypothetical protein AU467_05095 [Mesorhizobium loti]|uniref:Histidine kinase/HSP90-like ATPase domain-containing protein n=1 Tax=Rhizobium loti TaxID=381 RepID=A0A117N2P0_RHILI|nr:hypothetical protein AU467_05095 [Mesorhizobium loti]
MVGRDGGFGTTADRLDLGVDVDELPRASGWLEALAERDRWPERARFALQLSMEEALTNVITHAFADEPSKDNAISLSYSRSPDMVRLRITDNGKSFDPTLVEVPPLPDSIESAVIGGHGIRLMRSMLDEFSYCRTGSGNQLTLGSRVAGEG